MSKKSKQLSEDEFSDEFFSDDDEDSYAPESEGESSYESESDIETARPASPFSPLVKIHGVNEKEFNARNRGIAADDFAIKKKLFERGYKSDAGSDEDDEDEIKDFIEERKPKKSNAAIKTQASKARKSKTDYSDDDNDEYDVVEDNSASDDDEESRSQAESDSDADDLASCMASLKLTKQKSVATKAVQTNKSQPKARKQVDSDAEDSDEDKENDRGNRGGKSKKYVHVVKKEVKKVEAIPEPKKPMNAYAIFVKARTPALKMKHPHSNGTTIKEIINSEWADLDLKLKEGYQKKAKEDKRRYESEMLDWKNQQQKLRL